MGKPLKRNKFWICPYFKWDGRQEISCEGGRICFPDSGIANDYMNAMCASYGWKQCSVAQALNTYYERDDKSDEKQKL